MAFRCDAYYQYRRCLATMIISNKYGQKPHKLPNTTFLKLTEGLAPVWRDAGYFKLHPGMSHHANFCLSYSRC